MGRTRSSARRALVQPVSPWLWAVVITEGACILLIALVIAALAIWG